MKRILQLSAIFSVLICSSLSAQSMMQMKEKANKDYQIADAELNKVYKQVAKSLSKKGKAALLKAQKAWIQYRDNSAEAYGTLEEGGSLEGLNYTLCSTSITKKRTTELKEMFLSR